MPVITVQMYCVMQHFTVVAMLSWSFAVTVFTAYTAIIPAINNTVTLTQYTYKTKCLVDDQF